MAAFKCFSVFGTLSLFIATAALIVGLTTNRWVLTTMKVEFQGIVPLMKQYASSYSDKTTTGLFSPSRTIRDLSSQLSSSSGFGDELLKQLKKNLGKKRMHAAEAREMFKSTSAQLDMKSGLKAVCLDIKFKSRTGPNLLVETLNSMVKQHAHAFLKCFSTDFLKEMSNMKYQLLRQSANPILELGEKIDRRIYKTLDHVHICIICAVVLSSLALIASFIKLPCVNISRKKAILCITVCLAVVAAIPAITGVIILKQNIHMKEDMAKLEDLTVQSYKATGEEDAPRVMQQIFDMIKISEKYGYSHILACCGIVFLFIAVLMNIAEWVSAKDKQDDGYEISLISTDHGGYQKTINA